ncbi:MAG TPA: LamG-like jellyroll fold domain-containing protein, partial [Chryseosolibacter sp.]
WTSHTLTYNAATSTLTYYINGSTAATKTAPWTGPITFANSGPVVMGTVQFQTTPSLTNHGPEDWAGYLTGAIDEVRIYNKALTPEQVNALVVLQGKGK